MLEKIIRFLGGYTSKDVKDLVQKRKDFDLATLQCQVKNVSDKFAQLEIAFLEKKAKKSLKKINKDLKNKSK
jgi:hypothetical protein